MKNLCFIGGVSGIGKTTFIEDLQKRNPSKFEVNRFHDSIKEELVSREIPLREALIYWEKIISPATFRYLNKGDFRKVSLSDIHYSIQPEYDLRCHLKERVTSPKEDYTIGVDLKLIEEIKKFSVNCSAVLLVAPLKEVLQRREERIARGVLVRSLDIENILEESENEKKFFFEVCDLLDLTQSQRLILQNPDGSYLKNLRILEDYLNKNHFK